MAKHKALAQFGPFDGAVIEADGKPRDGETVHLERNFSEACAVHTYQWSNDARRWLFVRTAKRARVKTEVRE